MNGTQSPSRGHVEERDCWDESFEIILEVAWRGVEALEEAALSCWLRARQ